MGRRPSFHLCSKMFRDILQKVVESVSCTETWTEGIKLNLVIHIKCFFDLFFPILKISFHQRILAKITYRMSQGKSSGRPWSRGSAESECKAKVTPERIMRWPKFRE